MAKYRVDTDQGSYMVETEDPPAQKPAPATAVQPSASSRFGSGLLAAVNPFPALKHYLVDIPQQESHDIQNKLASGDYTGAFGSIVKAATPGSSFVPDVVAAQAHQFVKAYKDLQDTKQMPALSDRLSSAGGHVAAGLLPMVGPAAANAGEQIGSGDVAGGLGSAAGLIAGVVAPDAASVLGKGAGAVADKLPAVKLPRSGTPVQQAATDWALERGAPLDAAAATQNPIVRGVQELSQTTLGSSTKAQRAIEARNNWYAQQGRQIADDVHPDTQTPETAGRAVYQAGVNEIQSANADASAAYKALKKREADPANMRQVQTGTKQVSAGLVDEKGRPITNEAPVTENVPLPVDMRPFKAQFEPMLQDLNRRIRLGQQQYAPAQMAVEDIVKGPDFQRASVAEANLGALKGVSRNNTLIGGVKNEAGALAAQSIPKLQSAIDDAVKTQAGSDALGELQKGRLETQDKYAAMDLVDQFKAEPVRLYRQITEARDGSIDLLRKVQTLAPEQMPKLGRAYLDGALDFATESGGFDHAAKLFSDWQKLGPETKKVLFKNPQMISDLDNFFQSAKDSAKVENSSGTARVSHITAQGAMVFANPVLGTSYIIAGNVLSRLLYNPSFVRAAIRGFGTDLANKGAAAAAGARLAQVAGASATKAPVAEVVPKGPGAIANAGDSVAQSEGASNGTNTRAAGQSEALPGEVRASEPAGVGARQGASGSVGSNDTVVTVPGQSGGGYKAKYTVKELSDLQPSHNGETFQPNSKYSVKNDRDYANAANQGKVVNWSSPAEFDPKFHITDNPDATNGPVVTDSTGEVLGGNGRTMILQRVYGSNPKGAAAYRDLLMQKAAQFGIDPAEIARMKQPVLTREIPDAELSAPGAKQRAITDFNVKGTAELTPAERAIADSRRVSEGTLDDVAARLEAKGSDATLAQVLEGKSGTEVLNKLIADGVISPQERAAFASEDGLTKAGKDRISSLMIGRFFRDPAQLDTLAPSIRNKVERIAAPLARVEGKGDWNLSPDLQEALDLLSQSQAHGTKNLSDFVKQSGLFGEEQHSARAIALAKALQSMTPNQITAAARQYAQDAQFASHGDGLFGAPPAPHESFAEVFGGDASKYQQRTPLSKLNKPNKDK